MHKKCEANLYVCRCYDIFETYNQLEDHVVSKANNGNGASHYYHGRCCECGCTVINDN